MSMEEHLESMTSRFDELTHLMSADGVTGEEYASLSKEYADLTPIVEAINAFREARQEFIDAAAMIEDPDSDADMKAMAEEECRLLKDKIPELENVVKLMMVPKDEADSRNAILEIRAGTGGDEAGLFAADLFPAATDINIRFDKKYIKINIAPTTNKPSKALPPLSNPPTTVETPSVSQIIDFENPH